ncbi:hypothetical protein D043_4929A, partial [Vibrio parahaemolyticus EKP-021]
MRKSKRV